MGFFDKMFEKKECAICGTELGLLGKTKINEGYLCKECAGKLSPFFRGHRSSTADDIREQLAYREANAQRLASFLRVHAHRSFDRYLRFFSHQRGGDRRDDLGLCLGRHAALFAAYGVRFAL